MVDSNGWRHHNMVDGNAANRPMGGPGRGQSVPQPRIFQTGLVQKVTEDGRPGGNVEIAHHHDWPAFCLRKTSQIVQLLITLCRASCGEGWAQMNTYNRQLGPIHIERDDGRRPFLILNLPDAIIDKR
jgi:hypothetical protein